MLTFEDFEVISKLIETELDGILTQLRFFDAKAEYLIRGLLPTYQYMGGKETKAIQKELNQLADRIIKEKCNGNGSIDHNKEIIYVLIRFELFKYALRYFRWEYAGGVNESFRHIFFDNLIRLLRPTPQAEHDLRSIELLSSSVLSTYLLQNLVKMINYNFTVEDSKPDEPKSIHQYVSVLKPTVTRDGIHYDLNEVVKNFIDTTVANLDVNHKVELLEPPLDRSLQKIFSSFGIEVYNLIDLFHVHKSIVDEYYDYKLSVRDRMLPSMLKDKAYGENVEFLYVTLIEDFYEILNNTKISKVKFYYLKESDSEESSKEQNQNHLKDLINILFTKDNRFFTLEVCGLIIQIDPIYHKCLIEVVDENEQITDKFLKKIINLIPVYYSIELVFAENVHNDLKNELGEIIKFYSERGRQSQEVVFYMAEIVNALKKEYQQVMQTSSASEIKENNLHGKLNELFLMSGNFKSEDFNKFISFLNENLMDGDFYYQLVQENIFNEDSLELLRKLTACLNLFKTEEGEARKSLPIHFLASLGQAAMIKKFIEKKLNWQAATMYGKTVLTIAIIRDDKPLIDLYMANGGLMNADDKKKSYYFLLRLGAKTGYEFFASENLISSDMYFSLRRMYQALGGKKLDDYQNTTDTLANAVGGGPTEGYSVHGYFLHTIACSLDTTSPIQKKLKSLLDNLTNFFSTANENRLVGIKTLMSNIKKIPMGSKQIVPTGSSYHLSGITLERINEKNYRVSFSDRLFSGSTNKNQSVYTFEVAENNLDKLLYEIHFLPFAEFSNFSSLVNYRVNSYLQGESFKQYTVQNKKYKVGICYFANVKPLILDACIKEFGVSDGQKIYKYLLQEERRLAVLDAEKNISKDSEFYKYVEAGFKVLKDKNIDPTHVPFPTLKQEQKQEQKQDLSSYSLSLCGGV